MQRRRSLLRHRFCRVSTAVAGLSLGFGFGVSGLENVRLAEVPDYSWHAGCFGTATGNLMGYWDRHGFPDFYTGRTGGGVAPLNDFGSNAGIHSLWASEAGVDGRPFDQPGHMDDYWVFYQSPASDPYQAAGRPEHAPDCLGDFLGLSQRKWSDLAGECGGNIDGFSFNFFDRDGGRRVNFTPTDGLGRVVPDIQSGLRAWTAWRGHEADTFSQLAEFNPDKPAGLGFTFDDLREEIDAGYPVLLFMQFFGTFSRTVGGESRLNPMIHAMLAYGYVVDDFGNRYVRYRTSWASGDNRFSAWTGSGWLPEEQANLPLRGVIGYHPRPRIVSVAPTPRGIQLAWHAPLSVVIDDVTGVETVAQAYVVEESGSLTQPDWHPVHGPASELSVELPDCCEGPSFFRVRLVSGGTGAAHDAP